MILETFLRNIRLRILLLTFLTIVPIFALIVNINFIQLQNAKNLQLNQLQYTGRLIATEHAQIIEGARQLLITLSTSSDIINTNENCSTYLNNLAKKYKRYSNISYADSNGNVLCSAVPLSKAVNISNRYFFKSVSETKDFSIGEYAIGSVSNTAVLTFGYPVFNSTKTLKGVVYLSLDLNWLENLINNLDEKNGTILLVLDRKGIILARQPIKKGWVGESFPDKKLINNFSQNSNTISSVGVDGIKRLYVVQKIGNIQDGLYAVVGIGESSISTIANNEFKKSILILILISVISVVFGWYIGNSLITSVVLAERKVDQLKSDFVSLVSHQLRTPLTSVKYFCEILLTESPGKLTAKQREFISDSLNSTNRLVLLISTLLNIARIESGKIILKKQNFLVNDLILENQVQMKQIFKLKKLKFLIKSNNTKIEAFGDPKLIAQAISILLTNAVKYSYASTTIKVNVYKKDNKILIKITNNGILISNTDKNLIFSKFSRGSNADKADSEGAGLGLYLSRLILDAHGEKMWFTSSKKATSFFFTLHVD